jgi:geranylgeranyl diphosphate synthase type II
MKVIEDLRDSFTSYLEENKFSIPPVELYEPNNYFLSIGGKRLRPAMLLLANSLFGGKTSEALPAALALEYFHNFSLIHDDVMDKAPLRRGMVTIHEKYGLNTAILSGDVLLVYAYKYIALTPSQLMPAILNIFTETAIEVCEGQQRDMNFENREDVTLEEYLFMIRQKTSVLLAAGMKIGALIGGASKEDAQAMYDFALDLGIAFQIQDDYLDCYGDATLVGKLTGGDIIQNKKTLLLIQAMNNETAIGSIRLQELLKEENQETKVRKVLELFEEHKIPELTLLQRDSLINSALQHLQKISLEDNKKNQLKYLIDYLVLRKY